MRYSLFKPNLCLLFFVATLMSNVELPNFRNSSNFLLIDSLKLSSFSQTVLAQNLSSNLVLVYGNPRCGWTNRLIQELKARKIPYQFKNLDVQLIRNEWNKILAQNGVPDGASVSLPVVLVNEKVFMRPSIEQVIAQREKAQNLSSKIPNGWYIGESNSDAMIEIKNNHYCGANLETATTECYPIADLKYIKPGVVRLYDTYFCSRIFFRINPSRPGECRANGWNSL